MVYITSVYGDNNSIKSYLDKSHKRGQNSFLFNVFDNNNIIRVINIKYVDKMYIFLDNYTTHTFRKRRKDEFLQEINEYFERIGVNFNIHIPDDINLGGGKMGIEEFKKMTDSIGMNGTFIKKIIQGEYLSAIGDLDNFSENIIRANLNINNFEEFNNRLDLIQKNLDIIRQKIDGDIITNNSETVNIYKELDTYYGEFKLYIDRIGKEKIINWLELRKLLYKEIKQVDEKNLTLHKILRNYCNIKQKIIAFGKQIVKEYKNESIFVIFLLIAILGSIVLYFGYGNIYFFLLPLIILVGGFLGVMKKLFISIILKIILYVLLKNFLIKHEQQLCGNNII